ncbi:DUF2157 domain-containing protein [Wolbachia endosymbiont of Bemisia tabaci]|uniref:DUF2157 domain-containing protein n=1 Tax=Wolbachia endosymbiont of Bemisia tabaci TaxID=215173 RepID=UPI000D54C2E4|nr:DUF2157 domain-containing protein [Wolbachia endosymbiont of Bemisia tabaci]
MQVYKKNASVIRDALNFWKTENLITEDQADKLSSSVGVIEFDWKRLSMFSILLSILSFVTAAAALIPELIKYCKDERVQCMSLVMAAASCYVFGSYRKTKWPEKFYSNEGILFLGVLFTAAAIFVFSIVLEVRFSITSDDFSNLILISYIIYAVLGLLLSSKLIWCFSLLSLGGWLGAKTCYISGWGAYYLGMNQPLRFVLFGVILINASMFMRLHPKMLSLNRSTLVVGLLYLFISLWIMSIFGNYGDIGSWYDVKQIELFHWSLIFALVAGGAVYHGLSFDDSVTRNFGITFLMINLYTRFFEYFWNGIHKSMFFGILGISLWIIAIKAEKIFNINSIYNKVSLTKAT